MTRRGCPSRLTTRIRGWMWYYRFVLKVGSFMLPSYWSRLECRRRLNNRVQRLWGCNC